MAVLTTVGAGCDDSGGSADDSVEPPPGRRRPDRHGEVPAPCPALTGSLVGEAALDHALPNTDGLAVAFAGSYTTCWTFTFETVRLIEERTLAGAFPPARASGGEADA